MTDEEISRAALAAIRAAGIDYVLVGGLAVIAHTFPRTTIDADFVIAAPLGAINQLMQHFPADFRVDPQPQMETLTGTYRWLVEVEGSTFRVEIFVLSADPHHRELFEHRIAVPISAFGQDVWIPTAEDLVIQKVRWGRRRDLDDARNLLAVNRATIDDARIEAWCTRHGTLDRLAEVRASIPPGM